MSNRSNSTAWSLFLASGLVEILRWWTGTRLLELASFVLFACGLIPLTAYFAHQRRLAYLCASEIFLATVISVAGHSMLGWLFFFFATIAAVADCILRKRWVTLAVLGGAPGAALLALGGFYVYVANDAHREVPAATHHVERSSTAGNADTAETIQANLISSTRELPDPTGVGRTAVLNNVLPKRAAEHEAAPPSPPIQDPPRVFLDRVTRMYHSRGCPQINQRNSFTAFERFARWQKYEPHTCVTQPLVQTSAPRIYNLPDGTVINGSPR